MKFNLNIIALHTFRLRDTEESSHEYMHPKRDWMIILGCATFLFVGGVTYSVFDFYAQFVMPPEQSVTEDKVIRYRDTAILETAKTYDADEQMFKALRADAPPVPEPIAAPATTTVDMEIEEEAPLAE
jgi:hypothetical protein